MAVVREDVIKVSYDVEQNPFGGVNDEIRQMTSGVDTTTQATKGLGSTFSKTKNTAKDMTKGVSDGFSKAKKQVSDTEQSVGGLKTGFSSVKGLLATLSISTLSKIKSTLSSIAKAGIEKVVIGLNKLKQGIKNLPRAALDKLKDSLKKVGSAAASAAGQIAKLSAKAAVTGIAAASAAVIGLGAASINVGANFEASMSQVAATMGMSAEEANYTNKEYKLLADTAKEMGATTKFSASESAEALNFLALAGYDAEKSCAALPTVLNLAAAGGMELASASDMITDAMSALGIEATTDNLERFGDQLAKTAQKSNTSVSQLGEAVLTVGGTAKTLAGGTTELNTLLGIIADNGVKGSEGGTALRNVLLSLQAPTDTAAKTMKQLGLNVYDTQGKMRPMNEILGDLNKSMASMTDQKKQDIISTIFNKNDLKSVNALLANCGDRYNELSGYIDDSAGAMRNMADTMNDNLNGRITELKSAAEGAGIAIYEALGSSNLKDIVKDATGWISELTKATEQGGISGLAGAAGNVLAEALAEVTSMLPDVIDTGVDIVENLLSGVDNNSDKIGKSASKAVTSFINGALRLVPSLISTGLRLITEVVKGANENLPEIINAGQESLVSFVEGVSQTIPELIGAAGNVISYLVQGLVANAPTIIPSGVQAVLSFVQGAVSMLPGILSTGVQILSALGQGIVQSLPVIAQQGPQIIHDLIASIIGALPDLAKALFDGLVGIIKNLPSILIGAIKGLGGGIIDGIKSWFTGDDVADVGADTANSVASGITQNSAVVTSAVQGLSSDAANAFSIDETAIQANAAAFGTDYSAALADQQVTIDDAMKKSAESAGTAFSTGLDNKTPLMVKTASEATEKTKAVFDGIDLTSSGAMAGQGFANGLASQKSAILAQAQDIANSVSGTVNKSLDIHSPSRVAFSSAQYYDLGLIKGLDSLRGKVAGAAERVSSVVRGSSEPSRGVAQSTVTNSRSSSTTNNFSPSFTLNMNGASANSTTERKVRKWIREGINDTFDQLGRQTGCSMG